MFTLSDELDSAGGLEKFCILHIFSYVYTITAITKEMIA